LGALLRGRASRLHSLDEKPVDERNSQQFLEFRHDELAQDAEPGARHAASAPTIDMSAVTALASAGTLLSAHVLRHVLIGRRD